MVPRLMVPTSEATWIVIPPNLLSRLQESRAGPQRPVDTSPSRWALWLTPNGFGRLPLRLLSSRSRSSNPTVHY